MVMNAYRFSPNQAELSAWYSSASFSLTAITDHFLITCGEMQADGATLVHILFYRDTIYKSIIYMDNKDVSWRLCYTFMLWAT